MAPIRTEGDGRRSTLPCRVQYFPSLASSKIAVRPDSTVALASAPCQVGVATIALIDRPPSYCVRGTKGTATFAIDFRRGDNRKVVYLDRKVPGHKWVQVRHEVTNRHGAVAFVVSPKVEVRYVLVFKGGKNFQPSRSRVVTVKPAR